MFGKKKNEIKELKPPKEKKSFFRKKADKADAYMEDSGEIFLTPEEQEEALAEVAARQEQAVDEPPQQETGSEEDLGEILLTPEEQEEALAEVAAQQEQAVDEPSQQEAGSEEDLGEILLTPEEQEEALAKVAMQQEQALEEEEAPDVSPPGRLSEEELAELLAEPETADSNPPETTAKAPMFSQDDFDDIFAEPPVEAQSDLDNEDLESLFNEAALASEQAQEEEDASSDGEDPAIYQYAKDVDALEQDELEQLLNAAAEVTEEHKNFEYIENVDVYTQAGENKKTIQKAEEHFNVSEIEKNTKIIPKGSETATKGMPLERISMKALFAVAGIMLVLVGFITTLLVIQTNRYNQSRIYAQETGLLVAQSEILANNANYMYVSQFQEIAGNHIELSKVALSAVETVFYFRGDFRSDQFDFILTDDQDRFYMMDWGFYQFEDFNQDESRETVVRFEPIEIDAKYLVLTMRNPGSGDSADFQITFDGQIVLTPVRYLTHSPKGDVELDGVDVIVNESIFASTGSTITYALTWENESEVLRQDSIRQLAGDEYVTLLEKGRSVSNTKNYPAEYLFEEEKVILGRMDYLPVNDLNAKAEVQFNNLHKVIEVNETINVSNLFQNTEESQIEIVKGRYKIVLERMGSVRDQYVLVYHVQDRWIPVAPGSINNRVYSILDTTLIYTSPEGIQIPITGSPMAKMEGGDILYRKGSYQEFLPESGIGSNMTIEINTLNIQVEPVSIILDLEKGATTPLTTDLSIAEEDIITAFNNRLAYKSAEISKNAIQYIDSSVLNQDSLMREYEPETALDNVVYGSRIVTSHVDGNSSYFVVEETWRGTKGQTETVFYRTHKVVAELRGTQWVIIKDTIIK